MKARLLPLVLPLLLFAPPAFADSTKAALTRINECLKTHQDKTCRDVITKGSQALYTRFTNHDLMGCLPSKVIYMSEQAYGKSIVVRASSQVNDTTRYMRLVLSKESLWKLDIPASLKLSMGENWEKQVEMTEKIYLMMKQQMGAQLNCEAIRALANTKVRAPQERAARPAPASRVFPAHNALPDAVRIRLPPGNHSE